jgi:HEAT repeats
MKLTIIAFAAVTGFAQQPVVENGKVETQAFAGSMGAQLVSLGAGPFWAGYTEPSIPGRHNENCSMGNTVSSTMSTIHLEGDTAIAVLIRVEGGQVVQLRVTSPDCKLDAGGLRFIWIDKVPAAASVAWLKQQIPGAHPDRAISAIALHAGPAADQALEDMTALTQPENIRSKTAFWLGTTRGARGVVVLKRMLATDPSDKVREQVVFGLSQSKDPQGVTTVFDVARSDKSAHVRGQALFWLAQKAANKQAAEVINSAALNDPDRQVKERAVFALGQLPADQGVPLLIGLAKNNADPNVRKKAVFWLGQSKDPRAIEFFAQVLKP